MPRISKITLTIRIKNYSCLVIILQLPNDCNIWHNTPRYAEFARKQEHTHFEMCSDSHGRCNKSSTAFHSLSVTNSWEYGHHFVLITLIIQGTYMRCRDIRLVTSCSDMWGCMRRCRHRLGPNWISWSYTTSFGTLNRKTHEVNVMSHNTGKHTKEEEGKMKNEEEGRREEKKGE